MESVACRRFFVNSTCRLLLLGFLLPSSTVWAAGSAACEEFREQAAFIMNARLKGERRQELAGYTSRRRAAASHDPTDH